MVFYNWMFGALPFELGNEGFTVECSTVIHRLFMKENKHANENDSTSNRTSSATVRIIKNRSGHL